jgi:hypothetical protein
MVTNNYTVRKLISKSVIKKCDVAFYATMSCFHLYWKSTNFCAFFFFAHSSRVNWNKNTIFVQFLLKSEFRAHLWIVSCEFSAADLEGSSVLQDIPPSPWITAKTSYCARTICSTNQATRNCPWIYNKRVENCRRVSCATTLETTAIGLDENLVRNFEPWMQSTCSFTCAQARENQLCVTLNGTSTLWWNLRRKYLNLTLK